jgi:hypothetical protein
MSEEKKQINKNQLKTDHLISDVLKNVSQQKVFLKNASPKLTFILGLVIGMIIFSLISFISLFFIEAQKNQLNKEKFVKNKDFIPNIKPPTTPPPSKL